MDAIRSVIEILQNTVVFLLVLTVIVAAHELGHFWFARMFKMKVDAFAVFMGGVRKDTLQQFLTRPLAPAWMVYVLGLVGAGMAVTGGAEESRYLFLAGMTVLAVVVPLWVATRLEALYHLERASSLRTLGVCWAGAMVLLFMAARNNVTAEAVLGLLLAGSIIGILIVYYKPLGKKPEDSPMGQGAIEVDGQRVEVQFRPIWSFKDRKGTEFSLLALPLGGFAAIRGMNPKEDGSEVNVEGGFYSKSPFARFLVLGAGPLFSLLFGSLLLFSLWTTLGREEPTLEPVIGRVLMDGVAEQSGVQAGDQVMAVDGEPVEDWMSFVNKVSANAGTTIELTLQRGAEELHISLTPREQRDPLTGEMVGRIGVGAAAELVPVPIGVAARDALMAPIRFVMLLGGVLSTPEGAAENLGGPASIAQMMAQASDEGIYRVLEMAAMLSMTLGIMNLLPIVPLDGGQMVMAFVEMLRRGKRVSMKFQNAVSSVGFILLLALILSVQVLDIGRLTRQNEAPAQGQAQAPQAEDPDRLPPAAE